MKLLIEVWGTMYQDWNNELFRWDTDNYLKLTLEGNTVFSGQFSQLEQSAEFQYVLESYAVKDDAFDSVTNEVEALEYYKLWEMLSLSSKTELGDDLKLGYADCDLIRSGETSVKYGKYHLKKEIEVGQGFKFSDLAFVRLGNIADGIPSGKPYFASLISCVGHGQILLGEEDSCGIWKYVHSGPTSQNKDDYYCEIPKRRDLW